MNLHASLMGQKWQHRWYQHIIFKHSRELPAGNKATYLYIFVKYQPQKSDPRHVRFTLGGNLVHYEVNVHTSSADLITEKILFNSVISTPLERFLGLSICNLYLVTPMLDFEYMCIPV